MTKPNEQHQFDLLYVPSNVFGGNTYGHVLTGVDVASRYKVARALRTKKSSKVVIVLGAMYKKRRVFKYSKVFQYDNESKFKSDLTRLLEKTMLSFEEQQQNNELAKQLLKPMDSQELQDPEKVSAICVKNPNSIVNKMNKTKSSMILVS